MVQAKAKEQIGRKVTHKRTPIITERPAGIVNIGIASEPLASPEGKQTARSIMGKYAFVPGGSEEFAREKQREIESEDKKLKLEAVQQVAQAFEATA